MTVGEKISAARKKAGVTLASLSKLIGMSTSGVAKIEADGIKNNDPETLVKIADALNDLSILVHYCQSCPVRKTIFLKQFPDLNNINPHPAIITARLRKEMKEAMDWAENLSERFSDADFKSSPGYEQEFSAAMEQIIDVERCIETLKFQLVLSGTHSSRDLQKVYERQQKKCEEHGHHKVPVSGSTADESSKDQA